MNPDGPSRTSEKKDQEAALGGSPPLAFDGVNASAELVADLLAATGLLSEDKLNTLRGAAGRGSLAQAIVTEGFAASEGVARMLAARHHMPLVDLPLTGVDFEPQEDALAVRLRIDGVLHEVQRIPKRMMAGVTTRLKVLAKLDIAERRKPQDGRISLNAAAAGRLLDIRVATLPTVEGESVTMRLLDKSRAAPTLSELGLTAKISIEAALTGHFVLSTLHTNDAPGAITRLNEMGVEPFLTASAVSAVLAQRLARKLCPHCCESYSPTVEELRAARVENDRIDQFLGSEFRRKVGCPRCANSG